MARDAHSDAHRTRLSRAAAGHLLTPYREPHAFDVLCFSHLRWSFAFQRPQHLMMRFARLHRVYYVEEPVIDSVPVPTWEMRRNARVNVAVPHLPKELALPLRLPALRALVDELIVTERIDRFVAWYYTPDPLPFTNHLLAEAVVYDWVDLSATKGGATERPGLERTLMARADVVFIGGYSLLMARQVEPRDAGTGRTSPRPAVGWGPVLFSVNDAARVISPTRGPEHRATTPVPPIAITTPVGMSGESDRVRVAQEGHAVAHSRDTLLRRPVTRRQARADAARREISWERTWARMAGLVDRAVDRSTATHV